MKVFAHLRLAPSQLNPNSPGFIRVYELVCEHLKITPSVPMFFKIFQLQRKSQGGRQAWVSLKSQGNKLFDMFVDSVRNFKPRYFIVRAESESARESLYRTVRVKVDGEQVSRREAKFPLAWTFDHYEESTDFYLTKNKGMSEEDWAGLKTLTDFVNSFVKGPCVYKDVVNGDRMELPLLDKKGNQVFETWLIDTRKVLSATNAASHQMAEEGGSILKMLEAQKNSKKGSKKGAASVMFSAAGDSSSGSPKINSPTQGNVAS
ncbi:hypothetical protein A2U01_0025186, partial [Trifolium medium]|nr:hypothetical protein [Trifolium medium]